MWPAQKLLFVIDSLERGGAERSLLEFVSRLDRNLFEPLVCPVYATGALLGEFEAAGIEVLPLALKGKYRLIRGARLLSRTIRSEQPALLHTSLFRSDQIGRLAGRWNRVPVISSFVNLSYDPARVVENPHMSAWKLNALRLCDRFTARWVSRFHSVSAAIEHSNCTALGVDRDRVTVVPRGRALPSPVPVSHIAKVRAELRVAPDDRVLLNVGRLVDQKGQGYLISAMPTILNHFPTTRLLIAGEGWLRGSLERQISELGLSNHVTLLGVRQDIPALLSAADVFCFPSLYEGMPGALIEAMLAQKPIVATSLAVIRELIEDGKTGLLAAPRDPESFAQCVSRVLENRELATSLAERARSVSEDRFEISKVVKGMEKLYLTVLGMPAPIPNPTDRPKVPVL